MGCLEIVRPATNDRRSLDKTDRDAFLRRAKAKGLAQTKLDFGNCLAAYLDLGHQFPRLANTDADVESEKIVPVSHMGYPGPFGRQFEPASLLKEITAVRL